MGSGNSKRNDKEAKLLANIKILNSKISQMQSGYQESRRQIPATNSRLEPEYIVTWDGHLVESSTLDGDLEKRYCVLCEVIKNNSANQFVFRHRMGNSQPAHGSNPLRTDEKIQSMSFHGSNPLRTDEKNQLTFLQGSNAFQTDEKIQSTSFHGSNPLQTDEKIQSTFLQGSNPLRTDEKAQSTFLQGSNPLRTDEKIQSTFLHGSNPLRTDEKIQSTSPHPVDNVVPSTNNVTADSSVDNTGLSEESSCTKQERITAIETKMPLKHDVFLKRMISNFDFKRHQVNRGFYCVLCDIYEVYYSKKAISVFHDQSELHRTNLENVEGENIRQHHCKSCHASFYGKMEFWVDHINSNYHHIFHKLESNNEHRINSSRSPRTCNDFDKRVGISAIPTISVYDVLQEQTRTDNGSNNADPSKSDTFSKNINYILLVSDLPAGTTKKDIYVYFKDFGFVDKMEMVKESSHSSAKISFKLRKYAINIVNNGWPCKINGEFVKTSLIEEPDKDFLNRKVTNEL